MDGRENTEERSAADSNLINGEFAKLGIDDETKCASEDTDGVNLETQISSIFFKLYAKKLDRVHIHELSDKADSHIKELSDKVNYNIKELSGKLESKSNEFSVKVENTIQELKLEIIEHIKQEIEAKLTNIASTWTQVPQELKDEFNNHCDLVHKEVKEQFKELDGKINEVGLFTIREFSQVKEQISEVKKHITALEQCKEFREIINTPETINLEEQLHKFVNYTIQEKVELPNTNSLSKGTAEEHEKADINNTACYQVVH
ncbi:uncharacterized protein PF3D7_1120000-like [Schistocerca piceifrons]|uniref:uncharacterized protein PF3D7_1120000-like n=1 Tax=Schistocerca piceifrons TaxID=274613 RepID=UPI001F5ECBD1|nr:uncharacterized protein PF3D7_1120000-like [Schistocerca piceifrons]